MSFHIIPVLYLPQVLHLLYAVQVSDIEYSLTAIEQKTSVKKNNMLQLDSLQKGFLQPSRTCEDESQPL